MSSIPTSLNPESVTSGLADGRRLRIGALLAAVGFLAVWSFSLSRSILDPIGYDQALYQYMAERIIAGQRLYVDVWDQNGPGIVAIHWLSTHLFGSSPVALRVFDAIWQSLTLVALIGLAVRDGRRWSAGWIAAGLYVLSYYSMGYVHTAQREGFTVLPLLLMLHLMVGRHAKLRARSFIAGALGLFLFTIKPPLGLAFGALWLYTLVDSVHHRRASLRALVPLAGLTLGFIAATMCAVALLVHMGSWDGCWGILSRRDMPGYILGPALIRKILPGIVAGALLLGLVAACASATRLRPSMPQPARLWAVACAVFALLVSLRQSSQWQHVWIVFAGLWIPAVGSILLCSWRGRSEIWRMTLVLLLAVSGAVVLQGQFFLYHLPPMLALAAYLAAIEITERMGELANPRSLRPVWLAVCVGCIAYLAVGQWWPTMSFVTAHPNVLANRSLADHYTSITKHKLSCPTYATTIRVTDRIRELTTPEEPIASLFHEARIYYFAQRPAVFKLIAMQSAYEHLFADYMQAIRDRRPPVIVARIPERLRHSDDLQAIEAAVYDETESFFGPPGRVIRELYHVTEVIEDVCLLQPNP